MQDGLRIIVCGGRDYSDHVKLRAVLSKLNGERPIEHLFHGNARGADREAATWGKLAGIKVHPCPADWTRYGKRAGPIRNQNMLGQHIDLVVAFPGGRGTADMVKRARKAGVEVLEIGGAPTAQSKG